jgi:transcriptional antiterminator NusG
MAEAVDLKKWYVVRAVSGQENKIRDYMESEINRLGLDNMVEDILVPTQKVIQIRKGKKINKEKVYFPGYIMIKNDWSARKVARSTRCRYLDRTLEYSPLTLQVLSRYL